MPKLLGTSFMDGPLAFPSIPGVDRRSFTDLGPRTSVITVVPLPESVVSDPEKGSDDLACRRDYYLRGCMNPTFCLQVGDKRYLSYVDCNIPTTHVDGNHFINISILNNVINHMQSSREPSIRLEFPHHRLYARTLH